MFVLFYFSQDIYKYYVQDLPASSWGRRSSAPYALLNSEQMTVDSLTVLKKVKC